MTNRKRSRKYYGEVGRTKSAKPVVNRGRARGNVAVADVNGKRMYILMTFLTLAFLAISAQLVWVGSVPVSEPKVSRISLPVEQPRRGDIVDRNGVLLASSVYAWSVYTDPKMILDAKDAAWKLSKVLPDVPRSKIYSKLTKNGRFAWLKRNVSPDVAQKINALGVPGVYFKREEQRVYPQKALAAHILGAVNVDEYGIAGAEAIFDKKLRNGETLELSIDVRAQQQMRDVLVKTVEKASANSAAGVAIDPRTGEIVAMASYPDFDANAYGKAKTAQKMNRASLALYEMGSVFKLFTAAEALESGMFDMESEIDCTKPIKIGRFTINDFHPENKFMTLKEVIVKSSNIGSARTAEELGAAKMRNFLGKLGMYEKLDIGIQEVAKPLAPRKWGPAELMTVSYGHGISVTPLHVASGVGAIVRDGIWRAPSLVKGGGFEARRVMSTDNVEKMRIIMRSVVQDGTGRNGRIAGYDIGGKTGTAEKLGAGGYKEKQNIASFVGAVPLNDPKLVVLMMVDGGDRMHRTGGLVAAPAFKQFVGKVAPMLGIYPNKELLEQKDAPSKAVPHRRLPEVREAKHPVPKAPIRLDGMKLAAL